MVGLCIMLDLPQIDLVSFRVERLNFQVICNLNILFVDQSKMK